MANLKKGDNKINAAANIDLEKSGLNADNCEIVFETGPSPKSWKPGETLNALTKFVKGNDYLIKVTQDVEVNKL